MREPPSCSFLLERSTMVYRAGPAVRVQGSTHSIDDPQPRLEGALPQLLGLLDDELSTVAVTNPLFGEQLKTKASDTRAAGFTITSAAAMRQPTDLIDLEIGVIFLERAWGLVRIGIILPETHFLEGV